MRTKLLLIAFCLTASTLLWGGAYDDYVKLSAGDDTKVPSFDSNEAGHWQKNGVVESTGPHAGERYYTNGKTLCTPNVMGSQASPANIVFQGDELAVDGKFWVIVKRAGTGAAYDDTATVTIPHLTGLAGGHFYAANNCPARIAGALTVKSTVSDSSPFKFWCNSSGTGRVLLAFDLFGEANACFAVQSRSETDRANFVYSGNAQAYKGVLRVPAGSGLEVATGFTTPGTVQLQAAGTTLTVPAAVTATLGTLDCNGGKLVLLADGENSSASLTVTRGIENHGMPIVVELTRTFDLEQAEKVPVVTLAAGATGTLSAQDFALSPNLTVVRDKVTLEDDLVDFRHFLRLEVETTAAGQTLYVTHRPVVVLKKSDGSPDGSALLAANASNWDPEGVPEATKDYYVSLYNATTKASLYLPNQNCTFGGASLTIGSRGTLLAKVNSSITIPHLRFVTREDWLTVPHVQVWGSPTITGTLEIVKGGAGFASRFEGWNSNNMKIQSAISGDGDLILSCKKDALSDPRITYSFLGDNSAYSGRIRVWHDDFTKEAYSDDMEKYSAKVVVRTGSGLGGACASFVADAVSLEQHALLSVTDNAVFDEPTRGWRVVDCGRLEVPADKTVVITNTQITYAGEFRKVGAGRLALGGTVKFTEEQQETPLAGTNVLTIAEGSLTPASVTAFDGLAISFAAGTKLVLDASATGALRQFGLYNVKWSTPLTVAGGALPVEFVLPDDFDAQQRQVFGICTVSATAAEALSPTLFAVAAPSGMRAKVVKVSVAGESSVVTFRCSLSPRGLSIFIH